MAQDLANQIKVILEQAEDEIITLSEDAMRSVAKETADRIKVEAQIKKGLHKTGTYASGWGVSQRKSKGKIRGFVVHNKKRPGLTMLLEFGHIIRNGSGTYGRVAGIPHIKPAEVWAQGEIIRRLGKRLQQMR